MIGGVPALPPQEPSGEGLLLLQLSEQQSPKAGFQGEGLAKVIKKRPSTPTPCRLLVRQGVSDSCSRARPLPHWTGTCRCPRPPAGLAHTV